MTITHVNTQFGTPKTGGTPGVTSTSVVTKPTGLAIGDVMIAVVNANQAGITAPSIRWTRAIQQDSSVGSLYRLEVWYCVATSSETGASSFTWTDGDTNSPMWAAIAAYRGVNQSNPVNASNVNTAGTTNPQTGPNITSTSSGMTLFIRTVRHSSGTTTFSSSVTNERFDGGNNSTVGYFGALYDSGSEDAAGSISGVSVTASSGTNQTDTISVTLSLATADLKATAGLATATAAGKSPTATSGVSTAAGKGAATAAALQPTALAGRVAFAGVATASAAGLQPTSFAHPTTAAATATGSLPNLFFGTPGYRQLVPVAENRTIIVQQE